MFPTTRHHHCSSERFTKGSLPRCQSIAATVKQISRAIDAYDAVVMCQPDDEQLRPHPGITTALFFFSLRADPGNADIADLPGDCLREPLGNRIGMIEPRFPARHAEAHTRARAQIITPANSIRTSLQLMKAFRMEVCDSRDHPARHAQRKICVVETGEIAPEADTPFNDLRSGDPKLLELQSNDAFESRRCCREHLQQRSLFPP